MESGGLLHIIRHKIVQKHIYNIDILIIIQAKVFFIFRQILKNGRSNLSL